jgi:hypothetical protein
VTESRATAVAVVEPTSRIIRRQEPDAISERIELTAVTGPKGLANLDRKFGKRLRGGQSHDAIRDCDARRVRRGRSGGELEA